ncbi:MAG: hypothetical protein BKP49_03145 [Treponema sp. CETP13]|nr:MAG: hypothetical protein BKP49_03145 [Treponema sp. CETP13]
MDFGEILAQWEESEKSQSKKSSSEKRQDGGAWRDKKVAPTTKTKLSESASIEQEMMAANKQKLNEQEVWLQQHPVIDKDAAIESESEIREDISYFQNLPPEDKIDLHGLSRDQAWSHLDRFIRECKSRGLQKVLIVHGKGNHSKEAPVLIEMVRTYIEKDPRLGASGFSPRSEGGKGSTWVIIK